MTAEELNVLPGRIHDLYPDQEHALKEMWAQLLVVLEGAPADLVNNVAPIDHSIEGGKAQEHLSASLRKAAAKHPVHPTTDKEAFKNALQGKDMENAKRIVRLFFRQDHPDNVILRFLRARKWDVAKALEMLAHTLIWRLEEFKVNELVEEGELGALENKDRGVMLQFEIGKAFIYGADMQGRPLVVVRPEFHDPKAQSEHDIEKFTILIMEGCRGFMKEPMVDTAAVIFDLSNFKLHNMDYAAVKFILKCFEAHYPESLGFLFIHKAPWIFQGIWRIIKGWIDPVVASKISFTRNYNDLARLIDAKYILKDLGGKSDFEYKYIQPKSDENDRIKDTAKKNELLKERDGLIDAFIENTITWIKTTGPEAHDAQAQKDSWADKLRTRYWALDPYIRARTICDRNGTLAEMQPDYIP